MILRKDLVAQGGLDVEERSQRHIGDATMLQMFDFAINGIAKSGPQHANRVGAVFLDFEMDGRLSHNGYTV